MKNFFLLVVLLLTVSSAFAYSKGDVVAGVTFTTALPLLGSDYGEFNYVNQTTWIMHDAKLGTMSKGANANVRYFLSDRVAAGAAFGYDYFAPDNASGLNMDVSTVVTHYMLFAHIYINPDGKYKFYVPLGVGAAHTRVTIGMEPDEKFVYTGFAANWGLGVERQFDERWSANVEMRYNYNAFHKNKYTVYGQYVKLYPQASYISYSMGASYKF